MPEQAPEPGEKGGLSLRLRSQIADHSSAAAVKSLQEAEVYSKSNIPYTFAEHACALRHLRKDGITPTNSAILDFVEKRRASVADGTQPESITPLPSSHLKQLAKPAADSLAEPCDRIGENPLLEREILRQEEFLADAREWNQYLLARVDFLRGEIKRLQKQAGFVEQTVDAKISDAVQASPREENENLSRDVQQALGDTVEHPRSTEEISSLEEDAHSHDSESASVDWPRLLQEAEEQRKELENQIDELKVEQVLNQSLERVIEEQRLSLETSSQRVEALTRQLEEAGHLKVRAEQLNAELIEARSSLEAYRQRESTWRKNLGEQEALRSRTDAELHRLETALQQQQVELSQARNDSEHYAKMLEAERSRLHAEQARAAAIIAQLSRQLEDERGARRLLEQQHASEIGRLKFQLEQERKDYEAAKKIGEEDAAKFRQEIVDLQQMLSTAQQDAAIPVERWLETETKLSQAESRAANALKQLEELRSSSGARIAKLEAAIAVPKPMEEKLGKLRGRNSLLENELAESRANLHRLEALHTSLENQIAALEKEKAATQGELAYSQQESADALAAAEATNASHQKEIVTVQVI